MAKKKSVQSQLISWLNTADKAVSIAGRVQKQVTRATKAAKHHRPRKSSSSSSSSSSRRGHMIRNDGGPYSFSSTKRFVKGTKMGKFMKLLMPVRKDRDTSGWDVTTGEYSDLQEGKQLVSYANWFDQPALLRPFDILDDDNIKTARGYFRTVTGTLTMTNIGLLAMQVILYDIVARRDMPTTAENSEGNAALTSWDQGMVATGGAVLNSDTKGYLNINSTPYDSPEFCQKWKIIKTTRFSLTAGQTHVHNIRIKANRILSKEYTDAYEYFKDLSHTTLIVAVGQPCHKQTQADPVIHMPAVAPAALVCIKNQCVDYRGINAQAAYYQYDNNLDATSSVVYKAVGPDVEKITYDLD